MKGFSRTILALAIIAFFAMASTALRADTFKFNFTGSLFSGSGVFTATEVGHTDVYNITAVAGSVTAIGSGTSAITSLLGKNVFQGNDNELIYPGTGIFGSKFFDSDGVSFGLKNGDDVNLNDTFGFEGGVYGPPNKCDFYQLDIVDVDKSTITPEPSSLLLLGTGLIGMAFVFFRKTRTSAGARLI